MADEARRAAFIRALEKLQSTGRLNADDHRFARRQRRLTTIQEERAEVPIPPPNLIPNTIDEFLQLGYTSETGERGRMPRFKDAGEALRVNGWEEMPFEVKVLGEGAFGNVRLVFRADDLEKPMEKRHLSALKVQQVTALGTWSNWFSTWKEVTILRAIVHPHVIDIYNHFIITPDGGETYVRETGKRTVPKQQAPIKHVHRKVLSPADPKDTFRHDARPSRTYPHKIEVVNDQLWILMEYATAGNMRAEVARYPNEEIPEFGARYYAKQILDGLGYLHSKNVRHNDLHPGNIVLSYEADGETKTCKLCDFGLAEILNHPDPRQRPFCLDVSRAISIFLSMMSHDGEMDRMSPETKKFMDTPTPSTVEELLKHEWFSLPTIAPIPSHLVTLATPESGSIDVLDFPKPAAQRVTSTTEPAVRPRRPSPLLPRDTKYSIKYDHLSHLHPISGPSEVMSLHPSLLQAKREKEAVRRRVPQIVKQDLPLPP